MDPIFQNKLKKNSLGFYEAIERPASEKELSTYYEEKYYQNAKGSYQQTYSREDLELFTNRLNLRAHALSSLLEIEENKPVSFLELGCGEGFTLDYFQKKGWEVLGIDHSKAGIESQNPQILDFLKTGDIYSLLNHEISLGKTYDVLWMQNVLEHVLDPQKLLTSLRDLTHKNSILVITVPNDCSIVQLEALKSGAISELFWVAPPDHLSYFDRSSLISFCNHFGWSCKKMFGDFPVDWFLFHQGSNFVQEKSLGKQAHQARMTLEMLISKSDLAAQANFYESLASVGMGRNLTGFFKSLPLNNKASRVGK